MPVLLVAVTPAGEDVAMNSSAQQYDRGYDRRDVHNASVDEQLAKGGGCALVHLATGRTCRLEHGHTGSCHFVPQDQLRLVRRPGA
jgi:hypothetical protein